MFHLRYAPRGAARIGASLFDLLLLTATTAKATTHVCLYAIYIYFYNYCVFVCGIVLN